jgi:adenylate kinase
MIGESQHSSPRSGLACVFGISGVGKSDLIKRFTKLHSEWSHVAASDLIVRVRNESRDALRLLSREEIIENQRKVGEAIRQERLSRPKENLIVDAHSVIDNDCELVPVPTSAISFLSPTTMVFVYDDPEQILARRQADVSRRRAIRSLKEIAKEQEAALSNAREYSSELNVALHPVRSGDLRALESALNVS